MQKMDLVINRRIFLKISSLSITASVVSGCLAQIKPSDSSQLEKPNIILIVLDDAGYSDFGFAGNKQMQTPHIDRLAKEGITCTQGYVTASVCCPSRMGLMTGRYQQRFGAECNCPAIPTPGYKKADLGIDVSERTIGDDLRDAGYRTMMIGKWHLGHLNPYHPNNRGFDEFYGFLGGSRSFWPVKDYDRGHEILRNNEPVDELQEIQYTTDDFTDEAINFIKRNKTHPFFIDLSYNAVHTPMHAKEEDIEQCSHVLPGKRRIYEAMMKSVDENIGRISKVLQGNDLQKNTLIVFVNDNGGASGNSSSNTPLRGGKGTYWEGGIRVPFIIKWSGKLPADKKYDRCVSTLDLLPTFLSAAGAGHTGKTLDGVDLLPYLKGEKNQSPHDFLFWRLWRAAAARKGHWKLIRIAEDPLKEKRKDLLPLMLFNLRDDPYETTNVAEKHPERLQEMLTALKAWEKDMSPPRWYDGSDWQRWEKAQIKNHQM